MPNLNKICTLQTLGVRAASKVGEILVVDLSKKCYPTGEMSSDHLLNEKIRSIQKYLLRNIPWYCFHEFIAEMMNRLTALLEQTKQRYRPAIPLTAFVKELQVVVHCTKILIHERITELDLSLLPKMMRDIFIQNLTKLPYMRSLNLGAGSGGWKFETLDVLVKGGLKVMSNLSELYLYSGCSDSILAVIGSSCPHLITLDISCSLHVTDEGIPHILSCEKLQTLNLYRITLSVETYADLLLNLKYLETFDRCDDFGCVLEYLRAKGHEERKFNYKKFKSKDMTGFQLQLLVKMCPFIQNVYLFSDERISDLTVIKKLDYLTELQLLSCDFYTDYVYEILSHRGKQLTMLQFEHSEELDTNSLYCINRNCPNLQTLIMYNVEIHEPSLEPPPFLQSLSFPKLRKMTVVADCQPHHIRLLLCSCPNVELLHISQSTSISDEVLATVLQVNPMKHLKMLKVIQHKTLSMKSVHLLVESCDSLEVLFQLEGWEGITKEELENFKLEIRRRNWNLDISSLAMLKW